jgi:hypothetical protein
MKTNFNCTDRQKTAAFLFIAPSGGSLARGLGLDNLCVGTEARVLRLRGPEVGHELVLVGLLHGGQAVRPGPRQPLPLLLIVRELRGDGRLLLNKKNV